MKSKLRLNATTFSIVDSTPPFANTMLSAVVIEFYFPCEILSTLQFVPSIIIMNVPPKDFFGNVPEIT